MIFKALSLKQPWAAFITSGHKTIENRKWNTKYRGKFLIHASKTYDKVGHQWIASNINMSIIKFMDVTEHAKTGGIVGMAEVVGVITESDDRWFIGPYAFQLTNVKPLRFHPCRGMLNFFNVDYPWVDDLRVHGWFDKKGRDN